MMRKKSDNSRHILALSGGKDSAALAVYLKDKIPDLEYVFLDTGHELPETYEYLERMKAILGIKITTLRSKRDFDYWLTIFGGVLPSPQNRWCTRELKIIPYEQYIGIDQTFSYVGLRYDEDRMGYISGKQNIMPRYPFIEEELVKEDIKTILEDSGLGLPKYYNWRSRSGCYFCFFQRRLEWVALKSRHPDLFEKACAYEANHSDGRTYTWVKGATLQELAHRVKDEDINSPIVKRGPSQKLKDNLLSIKFDNISFDNIQAIEEMQYLSFEDEEVNEGCLVCTL